MVYHLRSIQTKLFDVDFNLWHGGGPDFRKQFQVWQQEQDAEWHLVTKGHRSYASVVQSGKKQSVFKRLSYPQSYFVKNFASEEMSPHRNPPSPVRCQPSRDSREVQKVSM